jgi:hypothetical protein
MSDGLPSTPTEGAAIVDNDDTGSYEEEVLEDDDEELIEEVAVDDDEEEEEIVEEVVVFNPVDDDSSSSSSEENPVHIMPTIQEGPEDEEASSPRRSPKAKWSSVPSSSSPSNRQSPRRPWPPSPQLDQAPDPDKLKAAMTTLPLSPLVSDLPVSAPAATSVPGAFPSSTLLTNVVPPVKDANLESGSPPLSPASGILEGRSPGSTGFSPGNSPSKRWPATPTSGASNTPTTTTPILSPAKRKALIAALSSSPQTTNASPQGKSPVKPPASTSEPPLTQSEAMESPTKSQPSLLSSLAAGNFSPSTPSNASTDDFDYRIYDRKSSVPSIPPPALEEVQRESSAAERSPLRLPQAATQFAAFLPPREDTVDVSSKEPPQKQYRPSSPRSSPNEASNVDKTSAPNAAFVSPESEIAWVPSAASTDDAATSPQKQPEYEIDWNSPSSGACDSENERDITIPFLGDISTDRGSDVSSPARSGQGSPSKGSPLRSNSPLASYLPAGAANQTDGQYHSGAPTSALNRDATPPFPPNEGHTATTPKFTNKSIAQTTPTEAADATVSSDDYIQVPDMRDFPTDGSQITVGSDFDYGDEDVVFEDEDPLPFRDGSGHGVQGYDMAIPGMDPDIHLVGESSPSSSGWKPEEPVAGSWDAAPAFVDKKDDDQSNNVAIEDGSQEAQRNGGKTLSTESEDTVYVNVTSRNWFRWSICFCCLMIIPAAIVAAVLVVVLRDDDDPNPVPTVSPTLAPYLAPSPFPTIGVVCWLR